MGIEKGNVTPLYKALARGVIKHEELWDLLGNPDEITDGLGLGTLLFEIAERRRTSRLLKGAEREGLSFLVRRFNRGQISQQEYQLLARVHRVRKFGDPDHY